MSEETTINPGTTEESSTESVSPQQDLERVRELILGPDSMQQRVRKAEVDRLREIIFGVQMQEYERLFSDLRRDIDRMLTDLRLVQDSVSDFEKTQVKRIETLEHESHQTYDKLQRDVEQLQGQSRMLQQILTQLRQQDTATRRANDHTEELRKLLTKYEQELRTFKASVSEQRDSNERSISVLKREVRQAEDDLRTELRRVADRLDDRKTDRKALAAMLIEIATRLETGSSVTGLLEDLDIDISE